MHLPTTGLIASSLLVRNAGRFVDFFFVLSGFVIAIAYRERLERGAIGMFLLRRIGRLWPLHLATLLATVVMALAGALVGLSVQGFLWSAIPANVAMVHGWGLVDQLTWNAPSWSISTEMFAYLLFGVLAWRMRGAALDAACAVLLAASFLILLWSGHGFHATYDLGAIRCVFGFMAGVLAARLWRTTAFRPRGEVVAVLLSFAAVAFLPPRLGFLLIPVFAWTILVFASDAGAVSRVLHARLPQLLGRVSYSIYMTHYIVGLTLITGLVKFTPMMREIDGITTLVAPWWISDTLTLAYLAAVVAVSCVTFAWIEQPGRRWFNQRGEAVPAAW